MADIRAFIYIMRLTLNTIASLGALPKQQTLFAYLKWENLHETLSKHMYSANPQRL